jgi:membrane protein DedA with SNARE-associated domain
MGHFIFDFLRHAIVHYGYWAVATALLLENAGLPVPGETVLLLASFLAYSEHELQLRWVVLVATLVTSAGGALGYAIGCYGGRPIVERYQSFFRISPKVLARGESLFARFGPFAVCFARFVFGMRVIAGPLAGVLRMPWRKFAVFNFLGAALWVTAISTVGYFSGQHWERLHKELRRIDLSVVLVVLAAAAFWWWRSRRQVGPVSAN